MTITEQKALVEQYLPLANKIAYSRKRALPRFIDVDDIKSVAYMGLVEASSRFQPSSKNTFATFAYLRIQGAITDYLRKECRKEPQAEEQVFEEIKSKPEFNYNEFLEFFENKLGKYAKDVLQYYFIEKYSIIEIAEKFQLSEAKVYQLLEKYKAQIQKIWPEHNLAA
jgi:RNA polymerase sigma factor for flagellar operon FliA